MGSGSDEKINVWEYSGRRILEHRGYIKRMENYGSGQPKYIGYAKPGTLPSVADWQITKIEYNDGTTKPPTGEFFASSDPSFDYEWDARGSYSYG